MAFILIIAGAILFLTAIRGTTSALGALLLQDIFGGFLYWFVAILIVGAIGYIKPLRPLSNAFLVLLVLVLFVSNRGFFARFNQALQEIRTGASTSPASLNTGDVMATGSELQGLSAQAQGFVAGGAAGL